MAAPANDDFANALLITGDSGATSPIEIVDATTEVGEPYGSTWDNPAPYKTIWFKWVAPSNGQVTFHTHASAAGDAFSGDAHEDPAPYGHLDTTLAIWIGSTLTLLTQVWSNDDDPTSEEWGYSSGCYNVPVNSGTTYYMQVGVANTGAYTGTVVLTWVFIAIPVFPIGPGLDVASNGWIIDIMDHDFDTLQSYRPETLHFTKRIRAVEDSDWEVSNSARNFDGDLVIDRIVPTNQDSFKPWKHMYQLRRIESGEETKIMAGPITQTNMAHGRDYIKAAGKDWLHYFERRQIPFDPNVDPGEQFRFGPNNGKYGYSYSESSRDIADILDDILTAVFQIEFSLPITWSLSDIDIAINYALSLGDTSTLFSIVDGLSEYWPGFDYRVSYDREFVIWSPYRFGDPDDTADDGPDGANIAYAFGDYYDHPVVDLEYTNNGPQATHLFGRGAGLGGKKVGKTLGASDIQEGFWRLDNSVDFGDQAKTPSIVTNRTRKEFIFQAQEVHEIELTVDPQTVDDFWNVIRPGFAIWLRDDLQLHELNSAQRIVSMDCTIDNEWNELVKLGLNQIYNTSSHYGVSES